ncbi:MAG TPA: ferrous iron transport protein B, partial [Clostridia bacterium]|nr:ferrous iron transport protein B [Clostridia bacterium]
MRFALAGNPNSGKTTLFNALTGSRAHVGNWPGVTIDRKEGSVKVGSLDITVIDLPGIYSLSPYTPEEIIARNYIIDEKPDLIINIIDATNLERNLYMTTQLMELDCPLVIALNMIDEVKKYGDFIDAAKLQDLLGIPVVPVSALRSEGIKELMSCSIKAASIPRKGISVLEDTDLAHNIAIMREYLYENNIPHPLFNSIKLIEYDANTLERIKAHDVKHPIEEIYNKLSKVEDPEAVIADLRYKYITNRIIPYIRKSPSKSKGSASERLDKLLTNKYIGIPLFLAFMFFVFHLTFGENLFGIAGVPSPGVWLQGLMDEFVGLVSIAAENLLSLAGVSDWVYGIVVDGIIGGVGSMFSFVPQVLLLFLFLSILEDSGYMARAAFLMDRVFRRFGLTGRSFLPMLMGFGCSVPAIMSARTLENEKARKITMLLVPFMSCGAKLPIYAIFSAAFFKVNSGTVVFSLYILGILVAIISGIIMKKFVLRGETSHFIMELPPYRLPRVYNLILLLWEKLKGFIIRAGTVILAATIVIWFMANFSISLKMVEPNSDQSILGLIGNALRPIFVPLGFASPENGWRAIVAIL